MLEWIKSLFNKKIYEPRVIEHRGMKGYFSSEMLKEFDNANFDYEKAYREAVDEVLDEDDEEEENAENPYR